MKITKIQKKFFLFITFILFVSVFTLSSLLSNKVHSYSGDGSGTINDPFLISSVSQLEEIKNNRTANYKLVNDIDLSGVEWTPIGNAGAPFIGTFDGNGYILSNLTIDKGTTDYVGLFGYADNASIKNVNLTNASVKGRHYTGALVGSIAGTASIENCSVNGASSVMGTSYTGGLAGKATGTIDRACSTADVTGTSFHVGGLVGYSANTRVVETYATGNVTGVRSVGGLIGYSYYSGGVVEDSFALGKVTATDTLDGQAGGLVGTCYYIKIKNSYSVGSVTGKGGNLGGLIGREDNTMSITGSYYDGVASMHIPAKANDTSRLTTEMKLETTYVGWDFTEKWDIEEGTSYPYLKKLSKPAGVNTGLPINDVVGGTGTAADPYIISTREQLNNLRYDRTVNYKLINDIDLRTMDWIPIGNEGAPFIGTFDGNGYILNNLTIDKGTTDYVGLFGHADNASIKNVNLTNASVKGRHYTGALVGSIAGTASIENCSVNGASSVMGTSYTGGLAGKATGTIDRAYSTADVTGTSFHVGGLVGSSANMRIAETYATGNVTGVNRVGGLIGYSNCSGGVLEDSFALGKVTATDTSNGQAGGLIGTCYYIEIKNSYSAGSVTGKGGNLGGLIGYEDSAMRMTGSYYDGVASKYIPAKANDTSRLTTGMKRGVTYTGWDFTEKWEIEEGTSYPYLRKLSKPASVNTGLPINDVVSGTGTTADPYIISTKEQLNNLRYDRTANYKLINDIDLRTMDWIPIGNEGAPFIGTFDGNGYTINNLAIDKGTTDYVGLFGYADNASIKNVNLTNASVKGRHYTGAVVGNIAGTASIENCSVNGASSVTGTSYTGGLAGKATGTIDRAYSTADVTGTSFHVGGLVGSSTNTRIAETYATGNVTGVNRVGGLIGYSNCSGGVLEDSFALGKVTATDTSNGQAGGLVGACYYIEIKNSYSAGSVTGKGGNLGGLIGYEHSAMRMTGSYYDGVASKYIPAKANDTSRLTTEMKLETTYTGWDFTEKWDIEEGTSYPYLRKLRKPAGVNTGLPVNDVVSGTGTAADPYIISTKEQLNNLRYDLTASYKLVNDINLSGVDWTPIGNAGAPFAGTFDGNGYTLGNLTIDKGTTDYVGLFGYANNASIRNINLNNASVKGKQYTGALVGSIAGTASIENCSVNGASSVMGGYYTGGLAGKATGTIDRTYSTANVTSTGSEVGGLVGSSANTRIAETYATGNVAGINRIGGLTGYSNCPGGVVENSFALGIVTATSTSDGQAGGLVGTCSYIEIKNSYSAGSVTGKGGNVGGMIGYLYSTSRVTSSYFDSSITGRTTPESQARTTAQLKQQTNYVDWDFTTKWNIDEANSYPYLRNIAIPVVPPMPEYLQVPVGLTSAGTTKSQITLSWYPVAGATLYEIETNNTVSASVYSAVYTYSNLTPNTPYTFRIRAINEQQVSAWSNPYTVSTLADIPQLPGIPQNVNAAATSNSITVSWDTAEHATGYDIEVDHVIRGRNVSVTNFVYGGLSPNKQYSYRVRALNPAGASVWSTEKTVITLANESQPPAAPVNVLANSSSTGINLKWDAVPGATGYDVECDGRIVAENLPMINYAIYNLQPDTLHTFRVKAMNPLGASEWSAQVVKYTAPGIPANLVSQVTSSSITITWNEVLNASGYEVEVFGMPVDNGQNTTYTQEGITPNTPYAYRVRAKNQNGTGDWSHIITITTLSASIGNLSAISSDNSVALKWDAVPGAFLYEVEMDAGSQGNTTVPHYVYSGLLPDTSHVFRVRAVTSGGGGEWSSPLTITTLSNIPTNIEAVATETEIKVTWSPAIGAIGYDMEVDGIVMDNGINTSYIHSSLETGSNHTYRIRAKNSNSPGQWSDPITKTTLPGIPEGIIANPTDKTIAFSWNTVNGAIAYEIEINGALEGTITGTGYVYTGVVSDTQYLYRIRAIGEDGEGQWSDEATVITKLDGTLTVSATAASTGIMLTWNSVEGATGYEVSVDGVILDNGMETTYEHTGLTPYTQHVYKVRAKKGSWTGEWSTQIIKKTLVGIPANGTAAATTTEITVTWDAVPGATGYDIEVDGSILDNGTATDYVKGNLTSGTVHKFRIRAKNAEGTGEWSALISKSAGLNTPGNLSATATSTEITVTWDAVDPVEGYDIEVDGVVIDNSDATTYIHSSLQPNTQHTYRVRAKTAEQESDWSEALVKNTNPEITINVEADDLFNFMIIVPGQEGETNYTIRVSYNPDEVEVVDLCAATPKQDITEGEIASTHLIVSEFTPGSIVFTTDSSTGVVNAIKFRAKVGGYSKVRYGIEK